MRENYDLRHALAAPSRPLPIQSPLALHSLRSFGIHEEMHLAMIREGAEPIVPSQRTLSAEKSHPRHPRWPMRHNAVTGNKRLTSLFPL